MITIDTTTLILLVPVLFLAKVLGELGAILLGDLFRAIAWRINEPRQRRAALQRQERIDRILAQDHIFLDQVVCELHFVPLTTRDLHGPVGYFFGEPVFRRFHETSAQQTEKPGWAQ